MEKFKEYKKEIILFFIALVILVGSFLVYNYYQQKKLHIYNENTVVTDWRDSYGEIGQFLKKDLNKDERVEVKNLIKLMKDREAIASNLLEKAYADNKLEEGFGEVDKMVLTCKERFQKYLDPAKKTAFDKYIEERLEDLESYFIKK